MQNLNLPIIQINEPCSQDWDGMSGSEQRRFCDACDKHVLNFSEMSTAEVHEAVSSPETARVCARIQRLPDGSILTNDCRPKPRRSLLGRVSQFAALATACVLAGCSTKEPQPPVMMGAVGHESQTEVETREVETTDVVAPEDQVMEMGKIRVTEATPEVVETPAIQDED